MRYLASAAAQSGCSRRSLWPLKWKSPISGTPTPARSRRSRIGATAAAASLVLTVRRTSSDPARASACTCRTVPSMSAVSVLVIDCTTIGAPPPTRTGPTGTRAEGERRQPRLISQVTGQKGGRRGATRPGRLPLFVVFGRRQAVGRRTALFKLHQELGARMVDFGGWDMPMQYSSQIGEHHAVRRAAGVFDVLHMCIV